MTKILADSWEMGENLGDSWDSSTASWRFTVKKGYLKGRKNFFLC